MSDKFNAKIMKMMEDKLIELMGMEEYMRFSDKVAQKVIREEIENMPDGDLKKFCLEHWDEIVRTE